MAFYSPLRYPGGKGKLSGYVKLIIEQNKLYDGVYLEPFAGGAGIALDLLFSEYVGSIYINDFDRSVYAFWHSIVNNAEAFIERINEVPVTIDEWYKQKGIQKSKETAELFELGFSTFFLNRANRSGILKGGAIGGLKQSGEYKIDARFNKENLISRIQRIHNYKNRIKVFNKDALDIIKDVIPTLPENSLTYFDPPYFVKGHQLYINFYKEDDHRQLSEAIAGVKKHWIVSYDNVDEIKSLYKGFRKTIYDLNYNAGRVTKGSEVMFFSDGLKIPKNAIPSKAA
ncbi:MAG: DNA adenine methylase [Proteobacteria bacterium]|nr:DNA adenine methylase [Pseudomonadota bacterium]